MCICERCVFRLIYSSMGVPFCRLAETVICSCDEFYLLPKNTCSNFLDSTHLRVFANCCTDDFQEVVKLINSKVDSTIKKYKKELKK